MLTWQELGGGDTIIRGYETLLIFDPGVEEDALEGEVDKLVSLIKDHGGEVVEVNRWGKGSLAYEIGKKRLGFYVLLEFFAEPAILSELAEGLKLNPSVLRYSTGRTWAEPPEELVKKSAKKVKKKAPAKKKTTAKKKTRKTSKKTSKKAKKVKASTK